LDEPTNDLDAETLELLEERLMEYTGTVIVVSHDRAFLDNVATSLLAFEPQEARPGRPTHVVREYVGGYSDWLRQRPPPVEATAEPPPRSQMEPAAASPAAPRRKLSYKEQQELAALPGLIERLEAEIAGIHAEMATEGYYRRAGDVLAADKTRLDEAERRLAEGYARWEMLEGNAPHS
ncbi:MAG: ABC transporter ATP-binding protein, partial [Planctomycetes bacterium]|nr:ABC transporter ATP-binding protein [Planctomycetota bacterium]